MRPRYFLLTTICFIAFAAMLVLAGAGFIPPRTGAQTNSPASLEDGLVEPIEVPADREPILTATRPSSPQGTSIPAGLSLLQSHCVQCHSPQLILETRKSRSEWEKTLAQMEAMGVRLRDSEKELLLDYLSTVGEP